MEGWTMIPAPPSSTASLPTSPRSKKPSVDDGLVRAVARYDFDGFGGQLSFGRGDEIILLNYTPTTSSTSASSFLRTFSSCPRPTTWCIGKRAMDGAKGIVYLPALKFPSSTSSGSSSSTSSSSTSSSSTPNVPRQGRLFTWQDETDVRREVEAKQGDDRPCLREVTMKGGEDHQGCAMVHDERGVEEEEKEGTKERKKEAYGPQVLGFIVVLLVILFILGRRGEAGWEVALLGFLPRFLAFLDRTIQRRFL